ncbi:pyocin knob domain-containing protein [Enterococcus sp.]|uniref:pyocin knob domain-containing protein n=1 Tax=Enterococcus sp. TaxID=35783 RepID=UPI0025BF47FE|nr:pyocin knob domain-containing protein [Enterococcus sp.]
MTKQWKNEDIIYPEDAQRWEDGLEQAQLSNTQNATNLANHADNKANPHRVSAAQTGAYTKSEADTKDAAVLATAKEYTTAHSIKKDNPHGVTAAQIGAYTKTEVDEKEAATVSTAKAYTDTKKAEAIAYTDQKIAATKSEIQAGSVNSATKLQTARRIAGVEFDGTKDISIPANNVGAYTKTETDSKIATTKSDIVGGNVASATKLQTARTINGVSFNGTSNISITANPNIGEILANTDLNNYKTPGIYSCPLNATAKTISNSPTTQAFALEVIKTADVIQRVTVHDSCIMYVRKAYSGWGNWVVIPLANGTMQSGLFAQTASKLNAARTISLTGGVTGSTSFDGSGNAAIATTIAGNAPSATKLATARTIAGVSFNGTSNIAIPAGNVGAYTKTEVDSKITAVSNPTRIDVSQYLTSSFKLYSGSEGSKVKIQLLNKGTLVISGTVSPTKTLTVTNNTQEHDLVSIPKSVLGISGSWSTSPMVQQASGAQEWLLGMTDSGSNLVFKMSRHRYGTEWKNCNAGDWLPFTGIIRLD